MKTGWFGAAASHPAGLRGAHANAILNGGNRAEIAVHPAQVPYARVGWVRVCIE